MKRKKKLPRYWLGTRMPTSLGYQPNYGIGNTSYTSTPGIENINDETKTVRQNTIPSVMNKGVQYGSMVSDVLKNTTPGLTSASSKAMGDYLRNSFQQAVESQTWSRAADGTRVLNEGTISATAPKMHYNGLNAAGKALAVVGAAYGLTDMGMQIADNKSHRTADDMRNTLTTNTYTTDLGNTYTTHSGPNKAAEMQYARAQHLNKNLNFTTSAIGTGAAIGSLFPGYGTAIGAGVGALVGLGANLLGFGDTEKETKYAADQLGDSIAMENRMNESRALDQDVKQGFYSGIKSGNVAHAKYGKKEYGDMNGTGHGDKVEVLQGPDGYSYGKATSMGMPHEQMYNSLTKSGKEIEGSGKGDTVPLSVEPGDSTAIYSKEIKINGKSMADLAKPYVEHQNQLRKIIENAGGSDRQKQFQIKMAQQAMQKNDEKLMQISKLQDAIRPENRTPGYKCGKLPKFGVGTFGEYALTAMPNIAQVLAATQQYNVDRNMPVNVPRIQADYSAARNAAHRRLGRMIDPRPYENLLTNDAMRQLYSIARTPGMGFGGRMVMQDSANKALAANKAKTLLEIQQQNLARQDAADRDIQTLETHASDVDNSNIIQGLGLLQKARAAKYNALAQDRKNMVTPWGKLVTDMLDVDKYFDAKDFKNRMIGMYENQQKIDKAYLDQWLKEQNKDRSSETTPTYTYPYKMQPIDLMSYVKPKLKLFDSYTPDLKFNMPAMPWSIYKNYMKQPWINVGPMYKDTMTYNQQPLYFNNQK